MSRMIWMGLQLHDMTDREILVAKRDIEAAREAVRCKYGEELAAKNYDDDLEELSQEIRDRPGLSERPALSALDPEAFRDIRVNEL